MIKYEKLKASRNEYDEGKLDTIDISNFEEMRRWQRESWMMVPGTSGFERRIIIHDDNRERLRIIFGKASFCWHSEFYYSCWLIDLGTAQVLILSAKDKGTRYEAVTKRNGVKLEIDVMAVVEFLKWLTDELMTLKNGANQ